MTIYYLVSDLVLYTSLSFLTGYLGMLLIPQRFRPNLIVSLGWIRLLILLIPLASFGSILRIVLYLYEDIGFVLTFRSVLTTFEVGHAWVLLTVFSFALLGVMRSALSPSRLYVAIGALFAMIVAFSWSGHASSIIGLEGFAIHVIHTLFVFIWTGGLLVLAWGTKNFDHWDVFLEWFKPLVLLCLVVISGSGILLMTAVIDLNEYSTSWILPYGQALLWKHLLILPVVIIGVFNGKYSYDLTNRDRTIFKSRIRVESLLLLLIFSTTALLGQQAPPHSIRETLNSSGSGTISQWLFPNLTSDYNSISLSGTPTSTVFFIIGLTFIALLWFALKTRRDALFILLLSLSATSSLFLAFLLGINVQ